MHGLREVPLLPDIPVELEDRAAPRFTLLIRTAKLVVEDRQYLCVVRDLSATGASIRSFHPLPSGTRTAIEFQNGEQYPAELVWQKDGEAGFQFLNLLNVDSIVAGYDNFPKRDLRFEIDLPVILHSAGSRIEARMVNLSRQGGSVVCQSGLSIAQPIRIEAAGLPEIEARVRWRKDGTYGLVFDTTFSITNLAAVICDLHARTPLPDDRRADAAPQPIPAQISPSR